MTTLKILPKLIPALLGAALLFAQPAVAGHGHHSGGEPAMRMLKGLDLTDAQREKIRTLVAASKAEKPATVAMQQQHQALQALVSADQFDEAAARLLLEKQQSSMLENRLERLKLQHSIRALLTDEQKTKLDARMAKMRERMVERVGKEN
jgi:protein CpxP